MATQRKLIREIALGAAAGAGATLFMQGVMTSRKKLVPDSTPPMRRDPADFMVEKAKSTLSQPVRERIPQSLDKAAKKVLPLGYGITSGALYGALRPRGGAIAFEGALLGVAVWAAGYLGWLPAAELMPPVSEHTPRQAVVPIIEHVLFGIAVVSAYDAMTKRIANRK